MARKRFSTLKSWRPHRVRLNSTLFIRLAIICLAGGLFGVIAIVGAWSRACANEACPSIAVLQDYDPEQASKVFAADGRLITDFGTQRRTVIPIDSMSPAVPAAFLAVEDKRFYKHHGVDWLGVAAAVKDRFLSSNPRGASTITMQLAGNVFPDDIDRSQRSGFAGLTRKIREARVATKIEEAYSKDKILELYLNKIDLGNRSFGVQAAAQRYFGKSASELNVAEAALLAILPRAPTRYNPRKNPDLAMQRRNLVIGMMARNGFISDEEAETWKAYPLALSSRSDLSGIGEYFVEYVRQQMQARLGGDLYDEGYRIHTTLDLDVQAAAERALSTQLEAIESGARGTFKHESYRDYLEGRDNGGGAASTTPYLQGAVIVMEARTGNILAMVGGRDFNDSKFNRAVQALRQPGSTFKPFLYSAALEQGYSLETKYVDQPVSIEMPDGQEAWEPQNYEGTFSGDTVNLRTALWKSLNSVAAQLGHDIGYESIVDIARRFGITTPLLPVPSITLGSPDVYPIEMVSAYTTFANLGTRTDPNAILRVEDQQGNMRWQSQVVRHRVLDSAVAYLMTDALQGVVQHGSGFPEVWNKGFRIPSGGKTGTTNDYRSAWYIGFTNDLVVGVWVGFDDNQPIMRRRATGGLIAAPIFTEVMKEIYQRRPTPGGWTEPDFMFLPVEIDVTTGFRATPFCPLDAVETRYFRPGTEPRQFCPIHSPYRVGDTH